MKKRRPTVSMTARHYRWLRWAADQRGISGCQVVQQAIRHYCRMWNIEEPPDDWMPAKGIGRPRLTERERIDITPPQHITL